MMLMPEIYKPIRKSEISKKIILKIEQETNQIWLCALIYGSDSDHTVLRLEQECAAYYNDIYSTDLLQRCALLFWTWSWVHEV